MVVKKTFNTKEGYIVFLPKFDFRLENKESEWGSNGLGFSGQMRFHNHQLRKKLGHTPEKMQEIIDQEALKQELKEVGIREVANENRVSVFAPRQVRFRLVDNNRVNDGSVDGGE